MSPRQRLVLIVTSVFGVLAVIFPPYFIMRSSHTVIESGLGFLFNLPSKGSYAARVDIGLLLIEIGVIIAVGAAIYFLSSESNSPTASIKTTEQSRYDEDVKNSNAWEHLTSKRAMGRSTGRNTIKKSDKVTAPSDASGQTDVSDIVELVESYRREHGITVKKDKT